MKLFEPLYAKTMQWSRHERAPWYLALFSFCESSFFPIPTDVMLAPMAMAKPHRWMRLAFLTTVFSVLGGLFGFMLGALLLESILPWLQTTAYWPSYQTAKAWFIEYGIWAVLIAGFSPVPYKVFTIAAGALHMAVIPFLLASLLARALRFYLVAGLMAWGGERMEKTLHVYIERLGWASVVLIVLGVWIWKG